MRKLWKGFIAWWMPLAEAIGHFMNRLILSVFYFVIVLPFGLGVRLFSDPLRIKKKPDSGWTTSAVRSADLDDARKQF
jgi:hypothetical protein